MSIEDIRHKDLKIVYQHGTPYGIRDKTGFLFFFTQPVKYSGQEDRYRDDCEYKFRLADFLLDALNKAPDTVNGKDK